MSFNLVNCCLDLGFYEACMETLLKSSILCIMVSNLPEGWYDLSITHKVFESFSCFKSEYFNLMVKNSLVFEKYECGSGGVVFGNLLLGGRNFGIIASHYFDPLMETCDVIESILPTLMACFQGLTVGGVDVLKREIHKADRVVIFGSLFCRDFPVGRSFPWPHIDFPSIPHDFQLNSSLVHSASCFYQPFLYDWRTHEVYVDVSTVDVSALGHCLDGILSESIGLIEKGYRADQSSITEKDRKFSSHQFADMLRRPYDYNSFADCFHIQSPRFGSDNPEHFCFVGSWIQFISIDDLARNFLRRCSHLSTGVQRILHPTIRFATEYELDDFPEQTTICRQSIPAKDELLKVYLCDPGDFMSQVEHFYLGLLKSGYDVSSYNKDFHILFKRLIDVLPRTGQCCEVSLGWSSRVNTADTCVIKMPH